MIHVFYQLSLGVYVTKLIDQIRRKSNHFEWALIEISWCYKSWNSHKENKVDGNWRINLTFKLLASTAVASCVKSPRCDRLHIDEVESKTIYCQNSSIQFVIKLTGTGPVATTKLSVHTLGRCRRAQTAVQRLTCSFSVRRKALKLTKQRKISGFQEVTGLRVLQSSISTEFLDSLQILCLEKMWNDFYKFIKMIKKLQNWITIKVFS